MPEQVPFLPTGQDGVHYTVLPAASAEGAFVGYSLAQLLKCLDRGPLQSRQVHSALDQEATEQAIRRAEGALRVYCERSAARLRRRAFWLIGLSLGLVSLWANLLYWAGDLLGLVPFLGGLRSLLVTHGEVLGGPVLQLAVLALPLAWVWQRSGSHLRAARVWARRARHLTPLTSHLLSYAADSRLNELAARLRPDLQALQEESLALGRRAERGRAERVQQIASRLARAAYVAECPALGESFDAFRIAAEELRGAIGGMARSRGLLRRWWRRRALRTGLGESLLQAYCHQVPAKLAAIPSFPRLTGLALGLAFSAMILLGGSLGFAMPQQAVVISGFRLLPPLTAPRYVTGPAWYWTWPAPFGRRYTVSLTPQTVTMRVPLWRVEEKEQEELEVRLTFRIVDVGRWALRDWDGRGRERLAADLAIFVSSLAQLEQGTLMVRVLQSSPTAMMSLELIEERARQEVRSDLLGILGAMLEHFNAAEVQRVTGVVLSPEAAPTLSVRSIHRG
jgi:hypothetical protein